MTPEQENAIDWSLTTWKGNRLRQHREFHALTFRQKLQIVEEMNEAGRKMRERLKAKGSARIDPVTREVAVDPVSNSEK